MVSTALVCVTLTSVVATLVVNSVNSEFNVSDVVDSFVSGSTRSVLVVTESVARGVLVTKFNDSTLLLGTVVN